MENLSVPMIAVAGILLLYLFVRIIRLPLKWLFKLALHAAVGFISLFVLNLLGSYVGIALEINVVNCVIAGILGVPGVILMLIFKYVI